MSSELEDRLSRMILFLEKLSESKTDFYVDDPDVVGEDFIKMGAYLLRTEVSKEDFVRFCGELWENVPGDYDDDDDDEGEVIFEA
jgi:hypothetical protein